MQPFRTVTLRYMIPGQTKNHVHGAFGVINCRLAKTDKTCPKEMFMHIDESGKGNCIVTAKDLKWVDWKELLGNWF